METNRLVATKPYSVKHHLHINNWVDKVKTDLRLLPESKWFWKTARVAECWTQVTRWTTRWLRWPWLQLSLQLFTQHCPLNLQNPVLHRLLAKHLISSPLPNVLMAECQCGPMWPWLQLSPPALSPYSPIHRILHRFPGQSLSFWVSLTLCPIFKYIKYQNSHGSTSSCIDCQCKGSQRVGGKNMKKMGCFCCWSPPEHCGGKRSLHTCG